MADHHRVVIIGGGTAGISVAARLRRAGVRDLAVIEPSDRHYYQPLWTLVGGGCAPAAESSRSEADVMPRDVRWIRDEASAVDPERQKVSIGGGEVGYDYLVVAPGIQLDWERIPGLSPTLGQAGVSSNYRYDLAPKTWEFISGMRQGTAIFTMPSGPIKCAGAPQKIAYLAAHWWQQQGVLDDIRIVLALATPKIFAVPQFARVLEDVAARYGIEVLLQHELIEVDSEKREAVLVNRQDGGQEEVRMGYDLLHAVPPQSAPDWVKKSPLATSEPTGYVEVDKYTLQHVRSPNIFALGDAGSTPNSKTGAAIRKQAPVVVANLLDTMAGRSLSAKYDGYASCPLTTARDRMLLAEFNYELEPTPSIPLLNLQKERRDMWYLKRYGLPFMYWNLMLRGLA